MAKEVQANSIPKYTATTTFPANKMKNHPSRNRRIDSSARSGIGIQGLFDGRVPSSADGALAQSTGSKTGSIDKICKIINDFLALRMITERCFFPSEEKTKMAGFDDSAKSQ